MDATTPDPRPSSHGGHTPTPLPPPPPLGAGLESRFDWYELTADGLDDGRCPRALALALGATVRAGKGRNGYSRADVIERDGETLATVYGGSSRAGEVHIVLTGASAHDGVPLLRRLWPEHRVSRADSALDFVADFAQLDAGAVAFAEERGLKFSLTTDSDGGSTRYLGSPTSEGRLRLYKKSEQLRALHPERATEIPDGIVRAEYVARPGKRAVKEAVSRMHSDDLWGLGGWAREFAQLVLGLDPVRTATHFRRPSDWSRSLHFLGVQYGPLVRKRATEDPAGAVLAEVLAALGFAGARVDWDGEVIA